MSDPTFHKPIDTLIVGLFTRLIICAVSLIGFISYTVYKHAESVKLRNSIKVEQILPTFKRGDCFEGNWLHEIWEKSPDGYIERVGKASYLVFFRPEAEKRGAKYGSSLPIASFDSRHVKVECPKTWVLHTHEKGKP